MRRALLILLFTASPAAWGESMGIRDVIERAVRANPSLAGATADIGIAAGAVRSASGLDDFVLEAGAAWTESHTAVVEGSPVQTPVSDDVSLRLGLTKPLPTGGRLSLNTRGGWNRTEFQQTVGTDVQTSTALTYAPGVELAFAQPLLAGAGAAVARAAQARAAAGMDTAVLVRSQTASQVIRNVVAAYWELVFATSDLKIRRLSAASARDQLERTEASIRVGKLPPSASAEVKVTVALRDEDVLFAERTVLQRSLDVRELAGMDIPAEAIITPADELDVVPEVPPVERALAAARERNPDVLVARSRGNAALVDIDASDTRPTLDFVLSGGPAGSADNASDALSQLGGFKTYNVFASLTFRDALGRNDARGAYDAAQARLKKSKITTAEVERIVQSGVVRQIALLAEARKRMDIMGPAIAQATVDLDSERARFEVGRASNFDVLRRQEELAFTQLRLARAKADYLEAQAALQALTGDLLGKYGVSVSGTKGPTNAP